MSTKQKHEYRVILFIDQNKNKKKAVDCVPSHWISLDPDTLKPVAKFMPPPYTVKKSRWLHKLVKEKENAVDDWPSYPIEVLENAESYSEAERKIQNWKEKDYMYTTDCNESDVEENREVNIKQKVLLRANLPEVVGLDGNPSQSQTYSFDSVDDSAHEDSSEDEIRKRKGPKSKNKCLKPQKMDHEPNSSVLKKPVIIEDKILTNPIPLRSTLQGGIPNWVTGIISDTQVIKKDLKMLSERVEFLINKFEQHTVTKGVAGGQKNLPHWTEKNKVIWPLRTKTELDRLNNLLADREIRKDFMGSIEFMIDSGTVIAKNVLAVMRKFLHKDLATKLTCVKPIANKSTLKPSVFYDCIEEVFLLKSRSQQINEKFSEKELEKIIGTVLTNSRDWDKGRAHVKKRLKGAEKPYDQENKSVSDKSEDSDEIGVDKIEKNDTSLILSE